MKSRKMILVLLAMMPVYLFGNDMKAADPDAEQLSYQQKQSTPQKSINKMSRKKTRKGQWEFYWDDANSIVSSKGKFRNGKQVGKWTYYSQNGSVERIEYNRLLSKKIRTEQYYKNGKIEKKGFAQVVIDAEYINYYWVGDWKCYDESGNYVKTEKYVKGELVE